MAGAKTKSGSKRKKTYRTKHPVKGPATVRGVREEVRRPGRVAGIRG